MHQWHRSALASPSAMPKDEVATGRIQHPPDASVWTCALRSSASKLYQAQRWVKFVLMSSQQRARCKTGQVTFQWRSCVRVAANPSTSTPIGAAPHSGLDGLNCIGALWVWRWMLQARAESKAVRRLEQQPSYKASTSERHSATRCTLSKRKRRREGRVEFVWRAVAEKPFEHHVVKIILTEDSIVVPTGLSHVSDRALASRGIARESVAARASATCKAMNSDTQYVNNADAALRVPCQRLTSVLACFSGRSRELRRSSGFAPSATRMASDAQSRRSDQRKLRLQCENQ